jgi:hypothetical protein
MNFRVRRGAEYREEWTMSNPLRSAGIFLTVALLLASASLGGEPRTTVTFAPAVAALIPAFGEAERETLESAVDTALTRVTRQRPLPAGVTIQVTFEELAPSHPTRAQLMADPAADPTRTHFLGGAGLAGVVRDANGHVLASVSHRYFPPTLGLASASLDPWADARLAIEQFADKLAAACRDLPKS